MKLFEYSSCYFQKVKAKSINCPTSWSAPMLTRNPKHCHHSSSLQIWANCYSTTKGNAKWAEFISEVVVRISRNFSLLWTKEMETWEIPSLFTLKWHYEKTPSKIAYDWHQISPNLIHILSLLISDLIWPSTAVLHKLDQSVYTVHISCAE